MALTDKSRVKNLLDISSTSEDTVIDYFIDGVTRRIENYLNTAISETGFVQVYDAYPGQKSLTLKVAPVVSVVSIHDAPDRSWNTDALIATGNYYTDLSAGVVHIDGGLAGGPQSVQVTYTGGLGTSYTDIISNGYEDLVVAAEQQVVFEYKRRDNEDFSSYSDAAGSVSVAGSVDWLPQVRAVLDSYRRYV